MTIPLTSGYFHAQIPTLWTSKVPSEGRPSEKNVLLGQTPRLVRRHAYDFVCPSTTP
jgi:hypothetical protein